jgi:hypothetical protein
MKTVKQGTKRNSDTEPTQERLANQNALLDKAAMLSRVWGPFLAFVSIVVASGIIAVEVAHTDITVIAITVIIIAALCVGLFARLKGLR